MGRNQYSSCAPNKTFQMATLWAALFLGESLTWPQIVGGGLVIAGGDCAAKIGARVIGSTRGGFAHELCGRILYDHLIVPNVMYY